MSHREHRCTASTKGIPDDILAESSQHNLVGITQGAPSIGQDESVVFGNRQQLLAGGCFLVNDQVTARCHEKTDYDSGEK